MPTLDDIYTYHAPFGDQPTRYERIRKAGLAFAEEVCRYSPTSREQSVALTNIQQAVMWTNAAIAINERAGDTGIKGA